MRPPPRRGDHRWPAPTPEDAIRSLLRTGFALVAIHASAVFADGPQRSDVLADLESAQQRLFERIAPYVVYIGVGEGFGSGFFVSEEGLILTNAHVVGKASEVNVILHDGTTLKGKVIERASEKLDLALVKVPHKVARPLAMDGFGALRIGSWVGSVGHGAGGIWTFTTGLVTNIYPDGAERPVFQTQIPLNPGNSGGPVFDRRGRVVGVVTAGIKEAQNINFAIRVDVAFKSLKGLASACDCLVVKAPAGAPIFVDGVMVGQGPQIILQASRRAYEVFAVVGGKMDRRKITWPETRELVLHVESAAR